MILKAHSLFDFGRIADEYDSWYETPAGRSYDRYEKAVVRSFLPPAKPGQRLLDVGCGTGHWSRFFASLGYVVVGVDISQRMVETAEANASSQCVFGVADACNLPFYTDSFEVVTAMATLEFISDAPRALTDMLRCAKPSGRALIGTLNRIAPINQNRLSKGREPYVSGRLLAPEELSHLLQPFGYVRMATTAEHASRRATGLCRLTEERPVLTRNALDGAFIVAEVRT